MFLTKKDDFDQGTACEAPICWSKYTTRTSLNIVMTISDAAVILPVITVTIAETLMLSPQPPPKHTEGRTRKKLDHPLHTSPKRTTQMLRKIVFVCSYTKK